MTQKEKIVFENMYARRSVREYVEGKKVEKEKIIKLLEAAMAAPSACNIQPWEFIVVEDDGAVKDVIKAIGQSDYNAQLVIVVCGCPKFIPWEDDVGTVDCAAAIENMLLAATAMDLGSVWVGGFDEEALKAALDIPDGVHPVGIAYFGYAAATPEPRTQYTEQAVHWGKFDTGRGYEKRPGCLV